MAGIVETNRGQEEGGDGLHLFLLKYKDKLRTALDPIYNVLRANDVDQDDLLYISESDLRETLVGDPIHKLKPAQIGKFIGIMKTVEGSEICKSSKTQKLVRIIVSNEEEQALQQMIAKSSAANQYISNIDKMIEKLKGNRDENEREIEKQMNCVLAAVHQRKQELIQELNRMTQEKTIKLTKQKEDLRKIEESVTENYNVSQDMINDTSLDPMKRKHKILENARRVLQDENIQKLDQFLLSSSAVINVTVDIENITTLILTVGSISHKSPPKAPMVTVQAVTSESATILLKSTDNGIDGYKLRYKEYSDSIGNDDDSKMEWTESMIVDTSNEVTHQLTSLVPTTKYILYAFVRRTDDLEFGNQSTECTFTTLEKKKVAFAGGFEEVHPKLKVSADKRQISGTKGCAAYSAFTRKMVNDGKSVYKWAVRMDNVIDCYRSIGVITDKDRVGWRDHNYAHWIKSGSSNDNGSSYYNGFVRKWNVGQIVMVELNYAQRTITFYCDGLELKTEKIEGESYYFGMLLCGSPSMKASVVDVN